MPESLARRAATSLHLRALDARDRLQGLHDPLVPPRRLNFVGAGDFVEVGDEYLGHLRELAELRPAEHVLEAGSGIGRIARPLTHYLDADGTYAGFDPDPDGVAWCQAAYANDERFSFAHVDVFNSRYHPTGTLDPDTVRFPHADGSVDVVVMASVLTHLMPLTAENYLTESHRVLAPGGRLLVSAFLLREDSRAAVTRGDAAFAFGPEAEGHAVVDPDVPEEAVAYDEEWLRARLASAGFGAVEVALGSWAARPAGRSFQDLVLARA